MNEGEKRNFNCILPFLEHEMKLMWLVACTVPFTSFMHPSICHIAKHMVPTANQLKQISFVCVGCFGFAALNHTTNTVSVRSRDPN